MREDSNAVEVTELGLATEKTLGIYDPVDKEEYDAPESRY